MGHKIRWQCRLLGACVLQSTSCGEEVKEYTQYGYLGFFSCNLCLMPKCAQPAYSFCTVNRQFLVDVHYQPAANQNPGFAQTTYYLLLMLTSRLCGCDVLGIRWKQNIPTEIINYKRTHLVKLNIYPNYSFKGHEIHNFSVAFFRFPGQQRYENT